MRRRSQTESRPQLGARRAAEQGDLAARSPEERSRGPQRARGHTCWPRCSRSCPASPGAHTPRTAVPSPSPSEEGKP